MVRDFKYIAGAAAGGRMSLTGRAACVAPCGRQHNTKNNSQRIVGVRNISLSAGCRDNSFNWYRRTWRNLYMRFTAAFFSVHQQSISRLRWGGLWRRLCAEADCEASAIRVGPSSCSHQTVSARTHCHAPCSRAAAQILGARYHRQLKRFRRRPAVVWLRGDWITLPEGNHIQCRCCLCPVPATGSPGCPPYPMWLADQLALASKTSAQ